MAADAPRCCSAGNLTTNRPRPIPHGTLHREREPDLTARELRAVSSCGVYSELLLLSLVETHCRQGVVQVCHGGEVGAGEASGIAEASQLAGLTAGGDQFSWFPQ